jgi:hypothetical protein
MYNDVARYDAYWGDIRCQTMRLEMIHGWASPVTAKQNVIQLVKYVGGAKDDYWRLVRIWRARMIVNAAYRGLSEGRLDKSVHQVIKRAMAQLDRERDKVLSRRGWGESAPKFRKWDWTITQRRAAELKLGNPGLFDTLRRNVEGKAYDNPKLDTTRMHRDPSLARLVRILRDVEFDHA